MSVIMTGISSIDELGLNTLMCVPVGISGRQLGALYVDDVVVQREFSEVDLGHLEMIAHQLGLSFSANPDLLEVACGEIAKQSETQRLRLEIARLKEELAELRPEDI